MLYQAFTARNPSPLEPLPIQYADFAVWQRQWLQGAVLDQQLAYWREHLEGVPPLELPIDYRRPPVKTYTSGVQLLHLPAALKDDLLALSQREGVTMFMLLLAAFQVLLARVSGQCDIAVGTPIANRQHAELEELIGFFVNTLVLRTDLSEEPSLLEVVRRVREVCLGAYSHQDIPFEQLVEVLQPQRDLSRSPLFQVMFTVQQTVSDRDAAIQWQGLTLLPVQQQNTSAKFDLALELVVGPDGLACRINYCRDLFAAASIERFLHQFALVMQLLASEPERSIASFSLLTHAEVDWLLSSGETSPQDLAADGSLHELIAAQVQRTPDAVALLSQDEQLSYAALQHRANQLAHWLRQEAGVQPEECVGVCLPRGPYLLISLLAILRAGGVVVPLEPTQPARRLARMLSDAQVRLVLSSPELLRERLFEHLPEQARGEVPWQVSAPAQTSLIPAGKVIPQQLAYVMYTSGSTGEPKGVMVSHQAIAASACCGERAARSCRPMIGSYRWRAAALTSPGGNGVARCWWEPVWCSVTSRGPSSRRNCSGGWPWSQVTVAHFVPAVLQVLLEEDWKGCEVLRCLLYGGDASGASLVRRVREVLGAIPLHHYYGPTEASINALWWEVEQAEEVIPIGRPISEMRVQVLDQWGQMVPVGVTGEICLAGVGLARGYQGRAWETAERFVPDSFAAEPGARLWTVRNLQLPSNFAHLAVQRPSRAQTNSI